MQEIPGYNNTVINIKEDNDFDDMVGIVYPGRSYSLDCPSLFYLKPVFKALKIHYLGIDLRYGENSAFNAADSQLLTEWINYDSDSIKDYLIPKTGNYSQRIFIAKSIGTKHLYNQIINNFITEDDILIFQTPIVPYTKLQNTLLKTKNKSLIIYGTKDPVLTEDNYNKIETQKNVRVYEVAEAGHVFETESSIGKSIDNIKLVINEINSFLESVL